MTKKTSVPTSPLSGLKEGTKGEVAPSSRGEIDAFLNAAKSLGPRAEGRGRLVFALDATMSRQPTWDRACSLQAEMFEEAAKIGSLDVQLVYFRGFGECRASKWVKNARALADLMTRIDCRGGHTQIGKVLAHALKETKKEKVQALVYIGDCMEENADDLCAKAGELGLHGVPVFLFQEGGDPVADRAFKEIARLTKGVHLRLDAASAKELGQLLRGVAAYAAGGRKALQDMSKGGAKGATLLLEQMR
ncbi:VWA domain-containing protein [Rhodobium gokarnense]|uniref:VWA domain-containing protein n=1 Tax=Rhodobium gokarnense TaxID=364296 RepID=A0ABT3HA36_9HYPH|nr:VWA domain-containing protein [Rhodobium gokarnense]MCW2307250.1 hypothetical protein [Rhodobium gokarnense]